MMMMMMATERCAIDIDDFENILFTRCFTWLNESNALECMKLAFTTILLDNRERPTKLANEQMSSAMHPAETQHTVRFITPN